MVFVGLLWLAWDLLGSIRGLELLTLLQRRREELPDVLLLKAR